MKKRLFTILTALVVVAGLVTSTGASALTADELQVQINALLAQLSALQSQLGQVGGTGTITGCTITSFTRNLAQGSTGEDVKCAQIILNSDSATKIASTGAGSPGSETTYFGSLTKVAVKKFQAKYGTGTLGTIGANTRAKMNTMIGTGGNGGNNNGGGTVPPVASGLGVSLASDTPASESVADNAVADFTKFNLTAGPEGDVKISKLYVTRTGLSANSDVLNIKVVDAVTGEYKGSIGSLNVDNRAMISFVPSLVITKGTTKQFYIRASILSGATAGKTIKLGIAANGDITSDATGVTGAPIVGNPMSVVALDIGVLTVSEDGSTINSQPNVGDNDVIVLNWKAAASSTEPVTIQTVTVKRAGTADASDTKNIELYDVTAGKTLGTVANWSSDDKATWSNLSVVVGKGETHRFKIMVDIVGGVAATAQTVNVDLVDGSDCLVISKGNTYGFYIDATEGSFTGKGAADQSINSGSLNISKSAATPATGNISPGDSRVLARFDFEAKGEDVKVSALTLDITRSTITCAQITNVGIYDENDSIVAGPQDCSTDTAAYTDTFIVPVGTHKYTVKAKIADAAVTGGTVKISVDRDNTTSSAVASGTITAVGMTSNDTLYPTPYSDVAGNTMTVAGADLNVTTLASPSGRSVAKGINDFVWATFSLDAGSSGEDINVTAITVTDTVATAKEGDIDNAELWADLTSANSARGDVYETRISDTKQPVTGTATTAFTLTQTVRVPAGSFIVVALVADLNAGATAGNHVFTIANATTSVTSSGALTGAEVTEDISGTGQTMTASAAGTLTLTQDSSAPTADILIGTKTATLNVFRLAASNVENMDLDSMTLSVTGGAAVDTFYFYNGSTLLGTRPGGTAPSIEFSDGTVTIPANGNVKITIKAKMLPILAGKVDNNTSVAINLSGITVAATGLASGSSATVAKASIAAGPVHQLYESRPTIRVASASPSGNLVPSTASLLAIFDVSATDTQDITFSTTSDLLTIQISKSWHTSDGVAGTWSLKDGDGVLLDTASVDDGEYFDSVTFNFTNSTLTVPAGETRQFKVYGDTHEFTKGATWTDQIQLWLDDSTDSYCTFDINGSTTGYAEGAIIFKGDIYAGNLIVP